MGPKVFLRLPDGRIVNLMWVEMIIKMKDEYRIVMNSSKTITTALDDKALSIIEDHCIYAVGEMRR